ncbi:histidine phosphatase superfamily [Durotheca rogersii]|uniref:histidine phosphatase superfamily n=1 Tax=Durotheca rogersii TaxID=419775 RepID=UPI0022202BCF|nr:histidine phosphatase superfamily [Durotheca rogersii]KAI5864447.1 histidine phosphatase superfamily [Durotheca rogersii]
MVATIHVVRHAQGLHNVPSFGWNTPDPHLTTEGLNQCAELQRSFPYMDKVVCVLASPSKRAIQTALLAFGQALAANPSHAGRQVVLVPDLREIGNYPCNACSSAEELAEEFSNAINREYLKDDWNGGGPSNPHSLSEVLARVERARRMILDVAQRWNHAGDAHIVVVSHGNLSARLTEDISGTAPVKGPAWFNAELRSYHLARGSGPTNAPYLVETAESKARTQGRHVAIHPRPPQPGRRAVDGLMAPAPPRVGLGSANAQTAGGTKQQGPGTGRNVEEMQRNLRNLGFGANATPPAAKVPAPAAGSEKPGSLSSPDARSGGLTEFDKVLQAPKIPLSSHPVQEAARTQGTAQTSAAMRALLAAQASGLAPASGATQANAAPPAQQGTDEAKQGAGKAEPAAENPADKRRRRRFFFW